MTIARLEHVNVTVSNPEKTANLLCHIFDWKFRWSGPSKNGGTTYHVGNDDCYIAFYTHESSKREIIGSTQLINGLNHIAITVDNIQKTEDRVKSLGFKPHNHGDYEPGHRFYFHDHDGIEYEVVSYVSGFAKALAEIAEAGIARR